MRKCNISKKIIEVITFSATDLNESQHRYEIYTMHKVKIPLRLYYCILTNALKIIQVVFVGKVFSLLLYK